MSPNTSVCDPHIQVFRWQHFHKQLLLAKGCVLCFPCLQGTARIACHGSQQTFEKCSKYHALVSCTHGCGFQFVDYWIRAVTNFSSRRGIVKSSRGTKKVWCYSRRLLLSVGGVKGLGKYKNFSLGFALKQTYITLFHFYSFKVLKPFES